MIYSQSTISYNANKHIELAVRLEAKKPWGLFADASWSRGNTLASEAEGQRFKSRAGQIGHSVANGLSRCSNAEMGPANLLHASALYNNYNKRFDLVSACLRQYLLVVAYVPHED